MTLNETIDYGIIISLCLFLIDFIYSLFNKNTISRIENNDISLSIFTEVLIRQITGVTVAVLTILIGMLISLFIIDDFTYILPKDILMTINGFILFYSTFFIGIFIKIFKNKFNIIDLHRDDYTYSSNIIGAVLLLIGVIYSIISLIKYIIRVVNKGYYWTVIKIK